MKQEMLLISEAAKRVEVETHVLRYWEDELGLPIKRNELGHRYYTIEDVHRFAEIKKLKEQGLQLKAIRTIIQNGDVKLEDISVKGMAVVPFAKQEMEQEKVQQETLQRETGKEDKVARLQYLLQHMMTEAVKNANEELVTQLKESLLKELDYQFRTREEREEERWKQEEEHFRRIDEMLRERSKGKEKTGSRLSLKRELRQKKTSGR